ncbi:MAG TPA: Na+/H+ antiporter subunit E [Candidatus Binatia bacterium]|nr:Na+/H+ antiporter subunit E [Candidatus Binatia bacterium]
MTMEKARRLALQFVVLFVFWLLLSGKLEVKYLLFGLLSAALVTFVTQDLLQSPEGQRKTSPSMAGFLKAGWRLLAYFGWLIYEIVQSNFQVAYIVLHPKLPIEPGLLRFRTRLRSPIGHVILANSITLTPGTITVDLSEGTYWVHALVPQAAGALLEEKMQAKLEAIFGEPEEPQPEIRWVREDGSLS